VGLSLAWVGVRGLEYERVLQRLTMTPTERAAPFYSGQPCAKVTANGWSVIAAVPCDHRIIDPKTLAALSVGCEVIACAIEEHVMFSSTELWSNGERVWQVMHQGDESDDHLVTEGTLPATFDAVVEATMAEQKAQLYDGVDYFEVPVDLAKSFTGFRYDGGDDPEQDLFGILEDGLPPRPWWKFWA